MRTFVIFLHLLWWFIFFIVTEGWKCPAGQKGTECTHIQIRSSILSNANYVGVYHVQGLPCTGRSVYFLPSKAKYLAYIHVKFWPYISSWMIFDNDPRLSAICNSGVTILNELRDSPGMHLMLQTSDLTPAHRTDKKWKAKSNEALYDYDSTVSSECVQGCLSCPSGKHSRGCDRLTLELDPNTFIYPNDVDRLSGTYERLGTGAGEHAIYARIQTERSNGLPNIHDVYISYLWFATYSLSGVVVFEEGYCLQWKAPPSASMHLRDCQYVARNPGVDPRKSDPSTPGTGPRGNQLLWSVNTYPTSPDFPPAPTMKFKCEECVSCPRGFSSVSGAKICTACPKGYYSNKAGQAICQSCPNGFHGRSIQSTSCSQCPNGKYSKMEVSKLDKEEGGIQKCNDCLPGYYSSIKSVNTVCINCPGGYYQEANGQSECKTCPKGFYQEGISHSTGCFECLSGTYSASSASTRCNSCPSGFSQSNTGSSECFVCLEGEISSERSSKCTDCGYLSYVYTYPLNSTKPDILDQKCVPCPKCALNPILPCGICDKINGFVQHEGFWNRNRTISTALMSPTSASLVLPPPTFHEIFLKCDVIGFKDMSKKGNPKSQIEFNLILEEDTACHINKNGSIVCKEGYHGFLCASCDEGYGHGSRKSTCIQCDVSLAGPWIRMITVFVVGMCVVAYIVKRKTRKQSASLERVVLLYFQFTGYAMALAVNWPSYVHIFLQLESSVGNANSFSYSDVECSFKDQLVFGSWFYTYCLTLLLVPVLMMVVLVCMYSLHTVVCKKTIDEPQSGNNGDSIMENGMNNDPNNVDDAKNNEIFVLRSKLINICVIVMYLMWSWCCLTILQVIFDCTDKGDGIKRLAFDLEQTCYAGHHRTFLYLVAIPGFICYVIGAPMVVSLILWRVRNRLGDPEVLARYGFLLAGYRRERFYWEMVIMLRRFCVVLAAVALDEMLLLQLAVLSLICLLFLIVHVIYKPYATDEATLLSRLNAAMSQSLGNIDNSTNNVNNIEMVNLSNSVKSTNGTNIAQSNQCNHVGPKFLHERDHSHGLLREISNSVHRSSQSKRGSRSGSNFSVFSDHARSSLPSITARTVAALGGKVYKVEMYALGTNYFTFYLALFLAGDHYFVKGYIWTNLVGAVLIIGNVSFVLYFIYEYKTTFVNKVTREKRNLKMVASALKGRAVNGWRYLKMHKPPVNSTMSIRVDGNMINTINSIRTNISVSNETDDGSISSINRSSSNRSGENMNELELIIKERILPTGWEEYVDANSGFFFWVNNVSGESTWEPPDGMIGDDPNPLVVERQSQMETKTLTENPLNS